MQIELEDLDYQRRAIAAVVGVLDGQVKNTFDNSNLFGIQANITDLTPEQLEENKRRIIAENSIAEEDAKLSPDPDVCIEMETGTGKTLVYLHTAYALYKAYRLTKFIILVPSIAIKEGVLQSVEDFKKPLADRYGFTPACFEYDSGKLSRLKHFIEDTQPQIMVMTIQSITSDDRIINQQGRDDSFNGLTFLQALGQCRPVIIMDEPQEGMDTENAVARLATLNPLVKLRYSATHKIVKNLLYRLTPFDAYQHGMVKKIEVLSVAERNDEATLKIELARVQTNGGASPTAKLKMWRKNGDGFKWLESNWLRVGDNLGEKSGNVSYRDYTIERIWKGITDQQFHLKFSNGIELLQQERDATATAGLFRQQLQWLIRRHFEKKAKLAPQGIKCLSLIFIDRVDSYVRDDGAIKLLFHEEYAGLYPEFHESAKPTPEQIVECQGYYFAKTGGDEYTDSENAMLKNKKIFDEILRDKRALLDMENPREFIFTHSALGVGWDNPNIFNIATLNQSYSDVKKRQELGRGLRICRNQQGQRIYDAEGTKEGEEINLLTIVPNETYETFAAQYQEQIKEIYGTAAAGSNLRKKHKGRSSANRITRKKALFERKAFRDFWQCLARKTSYVVDFREPEIVRRAIEKINRIDVPRYEGQVTLNRIRSITQAEGLGSDYVGGDVFAMRGVFSPLDLVEEWSESTGLSYEAVFRVLDGLTNLEQLTRNPYAYTQSATAILREIELEEKVRGLRYTPTGDVYPLGEFQEMVDRHIPVQPTPQRGIYDGVFCDSDSAPERDFARLADADPQVLCFIKLPDFYEIPTPFGVYRPDFGLVLRDSSLSAAGGREEFYFVIETKGTNDLHAPRALTEDERRKIDCAMKHFAAIGIRTVTPLSHQTPDQPGLTGRDAYIAPVKDYQADFKTKVPQP
jgi:type III restriction enzyme